MAHMLATARVAKSSARMVQCLRDIGKDVVGGLATDAETNETVADGVACPTRAAFRHRMHAAEAGRLANDGEGPEKCLGARPGHKVEADDSAEGSHLTKGNVMAWMRGKARVMDSRDDIGPIRQ